MDITKPSDIFFYVNDQDEYRKTGFVGVAVLQYKNETEEVIFRWALGYGAAEDKKPGFLRHHYDVHIRGLQERVIQFSGSLLDQMENRVLDIVDRIKKEFKDGPHKYTWKRAYRWISETDTLQVLGDRKKSKEALHADV